MITSRSAPLNTCLYSPLTIDEIDKLDPVLAARVFLTIRHELEQAIEEKDDEIERLETRLDEIERLETRLDEIERLETRLDEVTISYEEAVTYNLTITSRLSDDDGQLIPVVEGVERIEHEEFILNAMIEFFDNHVILAKR